MRKLLLILILLTLVESASPQTKTGGGSGSGGGSGISGLTTGTIPVAASSTTIANSSPAITQSGGNTILGSGSLIGAGGTAVVGSITQSNECSGNFTFTGAVKIIQFPTVAGGNTTLHDTLCALNTDGSNTNWSPGIASTSSATIAINDIATDSIGFFSVETGNLGFNLNIADPNTGLAYSNNAGQITWSYVGATANVPALGLFPNGVNSTTPKFVFGVNVGPTGDPNNINGLGIIEAGSAVFGASSPTSGTVIDAQGAGVINALTGFRVNNLAASGHYLRGNATNYVDSTIQLADLPVATANNNFILAGPAPVSTGSAGFVQTVGHITTGSQTVATVSITPAASNALVIQAFGNGCTGNFTITDNNSGSYTNLHTNDETTFNHVQVAVATNHNAGATTVTATASAACTGGIQILATEYSGLAASPSEGASGFNVAEVAQIATATASVTTTGTNDLLYMGMAEICTADNVTILSGTKRFSQWTGSNNFGTGVWDSGAGAAGTYKGTVNVPSCGGGTGSIILVALKTSGSTSGPVAYRKMVGNDLPSGTWYGVYQATQAGNVAAVTDTSMANPSAVQNFRFTGTINCTTTSAAATATLNLKYTDTGSTAQTVSVTDTCTALVTTGVPNLVAALRAKAGTNITWGVTIANTPTYDVDVSLEARAP